MNGIIFFFSSRRRHTRFDCDWSSDVCSSDLTPARAARGSPDGAHRRDHPGHTRAARRRGVVVVRTDDDPQRDRKSTRLNSSHSQISYAVFCLKKKKKSKTKTYSIQSQKYILFSQEYDIHAP